MSRRPADSPGKPASSEPIEIGTGEVQVLPGEWDSGEKSRPELDPEMTDPGMPPPKSERPFDPDSTLPLEGARKIDPELIDDPSGFAPMPAARLTEREPKPKAEPELIADPSGFAPVPVQRLRITEPIPPPEQPRAPAPKMEPLFEGVNVSHSGEKPLSTSAPTALPPPPAIDPAFLSISRGPGAGTSVAIPEGEHPIGRSANCFLCIGHASVSREHALVKRDGNRFYVRDANSESGTRVNGHRLEGTEEIVPGDQVALGEVVLVLRSSPVTGPELTLPGLPDRIRHAKKSSALLWASAAATALASAALASVVLTPFGERLFRGPPAPPPQIAAPAVSVLPTPPPTPEIAPVPSDEFDLEGDIKVKRGAHVETPATAKPKVVPTPNPTPMPPLTPRPVSPTASATEALRLFNEGEVDPAIAAARATGSSSLASKMVAFKRELGLAQADLSFQDGAGAIRHYSAAASLDEELSRGWSKPGASVRTELTSLLIQAGEQALHQGNAAQAVVLLDKALFYGPGNEKAERLVAEARAHKPKVNDATPAPDAPKPPPTAPKKDRRSAADEAFGE